jgi:hypothetical protein
VDNKLDVVSTYPNVSQLLNISRKTCVFEFSRMKGISEHHRREVGVNLTGGRVNAVEIGQKILGMPEMDELVSEFCHENGIEAPLVDSRYIVAAPLEMKYPEEEPVPDQTMLDDVVTH